MPRNQCLGLGGAPQGSGTDCFSGTTCFVDCNGNLIPDSDDIYYGYSQDCNHDFVPDECQLDMDADHDGVLDPCDACPNTVPGAPIAFNGCPFAIPGDLDRDGDVDMDDVSLFAACASGPAIHVGFGFCATVDFDRDLDVDQSDFAVMQQCFSGHNHPASPTCYQPGGGTTLVNP